MHASSSKFKKENHSVCIYITPPTFLRFMKTEKMKKREQISLMHSRIHASISYSFRKKTITFHASSNHPSYFTKSSKIISKKRKKSAMIFFCVSLKNVRHSLGVCRQFKSKIQVLLLYIKTLCKAMVINSFVTSRPFAR